MDKGLILQGIVWLYAMTIGPIGMALLILGIEKVYKEVKGCITPNGRHVRVAKHR